MPQFICDFSVGSFEIVGSWLACTVGAAGCCGQLFEIPFALLQGSESQRRKSSMRSWLNRTADSDPDSRVDNSSCFRALSISVLR